MTDHQSGAPQKLLYVEQEEAEDGSGHFTIQYVVNELLLSLIFPSVSEVKLNVNISVLGILGKFYRRPEF